MEKSIKVNGMHCKSCEILLGDSIADVPGAEKVTADSKEGIVKVNLKDQSVLLNVLRTIEKEGYKVIK